eukprot:symbB.v1.2.014461.t1/scaffold1055.1/size140776/3
MAICLSIVVAQICEGPGFRVQATTADPCQDFRLDDKETLGARSQVYSEDCCFVRLGEHALIEFVLFFVHENGVGIFRE